MTIEIRSPELEALIREHMARGGFRNVEDVLMRALVASPIMDVTAKEATNRTGADLIAAMQSSPYPEVEIEPARYRLPVRDSTL